MILKERVTSAHSLRRIDNEIETMQLLRERSFSERSADLTASRGANARPGSPAPSDGILRLVDVLHTKDHLCIVMERGGIDLFDLLDVREEGALVLLLLLVLLLY